MQGPVDSVQDDCGGLQSDSSAAGYSGMTDEFLNQILIGVGIVTCIAFGLAALLYWALS